MIEKKYLSIALILFIPFLINAQVSDDFSDGDFTLNPVWSGEDADFTVTSEELRLNNTITDDSHLMTASTLMDNTTWEFLFRWEGFSGTGLSSSNEVFFYLSADQNVAPETTNIQGFFVRIGNTQDEISLYRQDTDIGSVVELIDGNANSFGGVTASSSGSIRVRVTRDDAGLWTLFADVAGGTTFVEVGSTTDATYTTSSFAGIFIDYSSGNADGYFFDDVSISIPPPVESAVVESNASIRVTFDYDVDQASAELSTNYAIDNSTTVVSAARDVTNLDEVVLTVSTLATNDYQLTVSNVEDDATNTPLAAPEVVDFSYTQLALQDLTTNSATEIQLTFNDDLGQTSAETVANYSIDNSIGAPSSAVLDGGDNSIVTLTFGSSLIPLTSYNLTYGNIDNNTQNSSLSAGTMEAFTYIIPLTVDAVTVLSETEVELDFNLDLDQTTSETVTNYSVDNSVSNPTSATQDVGDLSKVVLTFSSDLTENTFTITINNVEDAANNVIDPGSTTMFSYLPIAISSIATVSNTEIEITFNQNVDQTAAETVSNYSADGELSTPNTAIINTGDNTKVNLTFTNALVNNTYNLTINGVANADNNSTATGLNDSFSYQTATDFRAIVINEIFADPTPAIGLPSIEFVELYNAGSRSINIEDFDLSGGTVGSFTLAPNAYVILTTTSSIADFNAFGDVVGVTSFNGLSNAGEQITLTDNLANLIDSLTYDLDWYNDAAKEDGGYTIEQINPDLTCGGYSGNWAASIDAQGGTPGTQNSIFDNSPDVAGPSVISVKAVDNNTFRFTFDEPMDEVSLNAGTYTIDNGLSQTTISPNSGLFSVDVDLDGTLVSGVTYSITITDVTDCSGNAISGNMISIEYDIIPPVVDRIIINSLNSIEVLFDEDLVESIAETESNFTVDNGIGNPSSAILDNTNNNIVRLTFSADFTLDLQNTLSVQNLQDLSNNAIAGNLDENFTYTQSIDTVIVKGVNLIDVQFNVALEETNAETLTNYFVSGGAGNPVLATLDASDNSIVHLVFGVDFDENDDLTLTTENLKSDIDEFISTPEYTFVYDTDAPELLSLAVQDAKNILLTFNERLDQTSAEVVNNYNYDNVFPSAAVLQSDQESVLLTFDSDFAREIEFELNIQGLRDLSANTLTGTIKEDFVYDIFPPEIDSLLVQSSTSILLFFNENVEEVSAETLVNYTIDNAVGNPTTATRSDKSNNQVLLDFGSTIPSIDGLLIDVDNVSDVQGNAITTTVQGSFDYGSISLGEIIPLAVSSLQIVFNKTPNASLAADASNYTVNGITAISAVVDGSNDRLYELTLASELTDKSSNILTIQNVTDASSNPLQQNDFTFDFATQFNEFELISSNTVEIDFDVNLEASSANLITNYDLTPGIGNPTVVSLDEDKVRLIFTTDFVLDTDYVLSWVNISDEFNDRLPDFSMEFIIDNTAPIVDQAEAIFDNILTLDFNEPLKESKAEDETLYFANNGIGQPTRATYNETDSTVMLEFSTSFSEGINYSINVDRVEDLVGNAISNQMIGFTFTAPLIPSAGDLIITEIMADPSPVVGLPELEYVEIYNVSSNTYNLIVVNFTDATNTVNLGDYELGPSEYLTLSSDATSFSSFGASLELSSFPSLTNSGETLSLTDLEGNIIDQASYETSWYRDEIKDDGGYALERIFFDDQCVPEINWIASIDASGGTPGTQNSVFNTQFDNVAPNAESVAISGTDGIVIYFDELLDSLSLESGTYTFNNGLIVQSAVASSSGVDSVLVTFTSDLAIGTLYSFTGSDVTDCAGNTLNSSAHDFGIGKTPEYGDLLFTEIMSDPSPVIGLPNQEFIEIYNNSSGIINLADIQLADASDTTVLGDYVLQSGEYVILSSTTNAATFSAFGSVLGVTSFPSLGNTVDSLHLFLTDDTIIDQLFYELSFYRDGVKDDGGYTLERIFFDEQCIQALNWIASTDVNGGTPGTQNAVFNTQFDSTEPKVESISVNGSDGIIVRFDEVLDSLSLENGTYAFSNDLIVQDIIASNSGVDSVQITFTTDLIIGTLYNIDISNIADCAGNILVATSQGFGIGKTPEYGDLLFTEIMTDPSPAVGLPEEEFIEIYNNSSSIINLDGIQLADASDTTTLTGYTLESGDYIILCSTSNAATFSAFGNALGVTSFPSLGNTVDSLYIFSSDDTLIDQLFYKLSFYRDAVKDDGGYSLERIFFNEQCTQEINWIASTDTNGGTPGTQNAVLNVQFDTTAPQVASVNINGTNGLVVHFDEVLDSASLESGTYTLTNSLIVHDVVASTRGVDSVLMTFTTDLEVGTLYSVTISDVADCSGNPIVTNTLDFGIGKTPEYGDLLFTEIMPDPSPVIGLPEEEFIEIYNNSAGVINLNGIQLADASDTTTLTDYILKSGEYVILSSTSNVAEFATFGNTLGVTSFTSLGNTVDSLYLFLDDNTLIEQFFYKSSFYRDEEKDEGGYSLERVFFEEQCIQQLNWIASNDVNGGTPGTDNSVLNTQFDTTAPQVLSTETSRSNTLIIHFDEVLDSLSLENGTYVFSDGLIAQDITAYNSGVDSVQVTFTSDLTVGTFYNVDISNITDCAGNVITANTQGFGIGKIPEYGDLLFTEIMPDPSPAIGLPEEEFIEIYNNSEGIINLDGIQLSDASDTTTLSKYVLQSGQYLILSSNSNVENFEPLGNTLGVTSFTSLSNTADSLYLFLSDNTLIDRLFYNSDFYRDEEKDDGGYSLERIFFAEQCLQQLNWIASADLSGGTPGDENSLLNGVIDTQIPEVTSPIIIDNQSIQLQFSEPMDSLSLVEGSYVFTNGLTIDRFEDIQTGGNSMIVVFNTPITNGTVYSITISNVTDCAGNVLDAMSFEFGLGESPEFNELIITEIMADPDADANSTVSLPSVEYLELYNPTDKNLELSGLTLQDGTSQTTLSARTLFSKQYLLLVPNGDEEFYPDVAVMPVSSWPTLNNGGETIALFNGNELIFSATYEAAWYKDSDKSGGGYSLEMIDVNNPCGDISNWTASVDSRGGTPAEVNSVAGDNPDNFGPQLLEAIANSDTEVTLQFDEKLNPSSVQNGTLTITPSVNIMALEYDTLEVKNITAQLIDNLETNQEYTIAATGFTDCVGNMLRSDGDSDSFILPEASDSLDIILNEILFNPRSNGVDFVEVYNNSTKAINLKNWQLSSINDDGELVPKTITTRNLVIDPASYMVFTTDAANIKENYPSGDESTFIEVSALSSMPNDYGIVILMDSLDNQIDRFDYDEDYHFNLLDDVNGVSLERINFNAATNNPDSWKSAASTASFATPGLSNSQFKTETQTSGTLTVDPKVFVPDNTGVNNFTTINYDLDKSGSFANIIIYNHRGQPIKTIAQGVLLSTKGFFTWDGTNDSGERANYGYYVIYFEIFNASGNTDLMKETIVLGTRF